MEARRGGPRPPTDEERRRTEPALEDLARGASRRRALAAATALRELQQGDEHGVAVMSLPAMARLRLRALRAAARGTTVPWGVAEALLQAPDLASADLAAVTRAAVPLAEVPDMTVPEPEGEWGEWSVRRLLLDVLDHPAVDAGVLVAVLDRVRLPEDHVGPVYKSANDVERGVDRWIESRATAAEGEIVWGWLAQWPELARTTTTLALARLSTALWRRILDERFLGHEPPEDDVYTWCEQLEGLLTMATPALLASLPTEPREAALERLGAGQMGRMIGRHPELLCDVGAGAFERMIRRQVEASGVEQGTRVAATLWRQWPVAAAGPLPLSSPLLARLLAGAERGVREDLIRRTVPRSQAGRRGR